MIWFNFNLIDSVIICMFERDMFSRKRKKGEVEEAIMVSHRKLRWDVKMEENERTSWYWRGGVLWVRGRGHASDLGQRHCHGNRARWTSRKDASRTSQRSCSRPSSPARAPPGSCRRSRRKSPPSRPAPAKSHTSLAPAGKTPISPPPVP